MKRLLDKIFVWLKPVRSPTYKIIHDPEFGYLPSHYDGYWATIKKTGAKGISVEMASGEVWRDLWVKSAEEAGRRINLHATNRGRTEVWSA